MSSRPQSQSPPSLRLARPTAVDAGKPERAVSKRRPLARNCTAHALAEEPRLVQQCQLIGQEFWQLARQHPAVQARFVRRLIGAALDAAPKQQVELARPPEVCRQQRFHSHIEPRLLEDFARKAGLWTF